MGLFTISCKKATYLVSKKEEGKLNWIESIQLRTHMTICSLCRLFEQQSRFITKHAKHMHSDETLTEDQKKKIEQAFNQAQ
jgi:predicted anti-sigma-YlaC factor YlaD